ncbi:MAG: SURF1 family protein [Chloroflexota bacterium]|nr:MAG: SURF1 family protein [Chloroflexota bacterium]
MIIKRLFSRQWLKTTILVIAAVLVMIRLGFWQLDRLTQRRAFNERVEAQLSADKLPLTNQSLNLDLYNMEYRGAEVSGQFDHENQVVLRNQDWQGKLGVHILTPLLIEGGTKAILVDRGWVPYEDFTAGSLSHYDVPGQVQIEGKIRRSQSKPLIGGRADDIPGPGEPPLTAWNWINIANISRQIPYELLPVYLVSSPDPSSNQLPYRSHQDLDLTEGSHLGYAFQWFTFAAILAIGYPIFVRKEEERRSPSNRKVTPYFKSDQSNNQEPESNLKGYEQP